MSNFDSPPRDGALAKVLSSFMLAIFATSIIAVPLLQWNIERGVGVAMILFPIHFGLAWAVGGWIPFVQTLGWFWVALFLVTVKKIVPIPIDFSSNLEDDRLLEMELHTRRRLLETESEERFSELAEILRAKHRFQTNRRRVFLFAATMAAIGTALLYLDFAQLKGNGKSVVVPVTWKNTDPQNLLLAFPFIFILLSVPLCVLFASYSKAYLAACIAGTLYFGTAFLLIFRPSLPDMPILLPYLVVGITLIGVGLIVEWVTADSSYLTVGGVSDT